MGYSIERDVRNLVNSMKITDWLKPIKKTPGERLMEVFSNPESRRTIFVVTLAELWQEHLLLP